MWTFKHVCTKAFKDPGVVLISKNIKSHSFKFSSRHEFLNTTLTYQKIFHIRYVSSRAAFVPFDNIVEYRRAQAQRSILIQVQSEKSCQELFILASQYGTVESMHHYTLPGHTHFVLVEMKDPHITRRMLNNCGHLDKSQVVPVRSPFLWFRANKSQQSKTVEEVVFDRSKCNSFNIHPPSEEEVKDTLSSCINITEQMIALHKMTRINDVSTRLRYLVAYQVELALSGLFPLCVIYPFGSSVNEFGKQGSDLDLVMQLDNQSREGSDQSRLMFHCKSSLGSERSQTLRHLETVGDLLQLFLPGCSQVKRILGARVPIIKYNHDMTGLECDLSMTNLTALYMAELLFVYGEIDWRVRPLVFTIRKWAKNINLTNPTPGRWITNFSLTILVLFYLQSVKVLPPLKLLVDQAVSKDRRVADDGVNCTFLRDISKLQFHASIPDQSSDSLTTLLFGFFEFYSQFDFNNNGISLYLGAPISKPEYGALYINNPLEKGLNVSKNVSFEEIERLKVELRNALWILESTAISNKTGHAVEAWGLLELFKKQNLSEKAKTVFFSEKARPKERLITVEDLFSETDDSVEVPKVDPEFKKRKPISAQTLKAVQKAMKSKRR